jgi:hypothetical protein
VQTVFAEEEEDCMKPKEMGCSFWVLGWVYQRVCPVAPETLAVHLDKEV